MRSTQLLVQFIKYSNVTRVIDNTSKLIMISYIIFIYFGFCT